MLSRPPIRARDFVKDIRSGMSDAELLTKYDLSCAGLAKVLELLVERKVLSRIELDNRPNAEESIPDVIDFRETERIKPAYDIPVYDVQAPHAQGTLLDLSTKGVQISGIPSAVGETRSFRVGAEFGEFASFTFQAQCQWVEKEGGARAPLRAGYQITSISYDAFRHLQQLIQICNAPTQMRVSWDRGDPSRRCSGEGPDFDKL
ncbi:MAG: hypothetical protein LDL33_12740 [Desulfomonile sp.]|nr:hypothetical protein [Desulfomonile sp.]